MGVGSLVLALVIGSVVLNILGPLRGMSEKKMAVYEDMLPADPYKLDDTFITKGWVQVAEGKKGEIAHQWGDNSHENYLKIDPEAQRRTLEFIERNAKAGKPFYVANWPNLTYNLRSIKVLGLTVLFEQEWSSS